VRKSTEKDREKKGRSNVGSFTLMDENMADTARGFLFPS